ncbi:MAG: TIGR02757 family protein [Lutibacter sp.]
MTKQELKEFLDEKVKTYNNPKFIESDPIQIPHLFTQKEDIEISGFLTATIAWGNRKSIIKNAKRMMEIMDFSPFDFIINHDATDLKSLPKFVHRTFNHSDLQYFLKTLQIIYKNYGGLEQIFAENATNFSTQTAITALNHLFFSFPHEKRIEKHLANPEKGSAAKRINMFLRWMVRQDNNGVDFGIWTKIKPSQLSCPLDVHSGNVARKLNLLTRKQNDAKALQELDYQLRLLDKKDPTQYDFALFGLGVFEKF